MATLSTKKFSTIVADFVAAVQGAAKTLVDFTEGSVLLAVAEAVAGNALWLQGLWFQTLQATRLSTSTGSDVDTWLADFMPNAPGSTTPRIGARAAVGVLTFGRTTAAGSAIIPVGTQAMTSDGSQVFVVIADPLNSSYSATVSGYRVAAGVTFIDIPVNALVPGSGGNVVPGSVTLLRSSIPGIDSVTNLAPLYAGMDQETDEQLKSRFPLFIASLARGTAPAIAYGITTVQQGLQYSIIENYQHDQQFDAGYLTIIIDDGSGAPPASLVTAVTESVNIYRAAGVRFGVFPPVVVGVTVSMAIETSVGYDHNAIVSSVATAIAAYVNGLGLGKTLRWSKLEQIAYEVSPAITNVASLLVNGTQADVIAASYSTIKTSAVTVS